MTRQDKPVEPPCKGLRHSKEQPGYYECLKCGSLSGDDWTQCEGVCPVEQSPHYDERCGYAFEDIPTPEETV